MRSATFLILAACLAHAQTRPPITGIATFAVKVGDMDEARKFYSGVLGFDEIFVSKATGGTVFKVNDHQYVELSPGLKGDEDRLVFIGLETSDARRMAAYLAGKGVDAPKSLTPDADGNLSFTVHDPLNHAIRFVQYLPGSAHSKLFGQHLSARRTSEHILHAGIQVSDRAAADRFYMDILKCRFMWLGGPPDTNPKAYLSVMLPEGTDWIEYMMNNQHPNVRQLAGSHHMALGVEDIQTPYRTITERGYKSAKPVIGRGDGRWLLNAYDPYYTRTEFMVRKPVMTPCCSPLEDPVIQPKGRTTKLYFIDVELGNAVLMVTPNGKSILLDSGPDIYSDRVLAALKDAGVKQIDYAVVSHFHWEHYGAFAKIARQVPILTFVDHGPLADNDGIYARAREYPGDPTTPDFDSYFKARLGIKRLEPNVGDKISIDGVDLNIVTALGHALVKPLSGAATKNASCANVQRRQDDLSEDAQSIGVVMNFGKFRFADLGDLTWNVSHSLFCPENKAGQVDLYLVTRHAMSDPDPPRACCSPAEVFSLAPRAAILSGPYQLPQGKSELETVRQSPGPEDLWQLNAPTEDRLVVNSDSEKCPGRWLKVTAQEDGSFTVTNVGNGFSKHYGPRPVHK